MLKTWSVAKSDVTLDSYRDYLQISKQPQGDVPASFFCSDSFLGILDEEDYVPFDASRWRPWLSPRSKVSEVYSEGTCLAQKSLSRLSTSLESGLTCNQMSNALYSSAKLSRQKSLPRTQTVSHHSHVPTKKGSTPSASQESTLVSSSWRKTNRGRCTDVRTISPRRHPHLPAWWTRSSLGCPSMTPPSTLGHRVSFACC